MNDIISFIWISIVQLVFEYFIPFKKIEIATGFREFTCMNLGVAICGLGVE